jgi:hypothetical protein
MGRKWAVKSNTRLSGDGLSRCKVGNTSRYLWFLILRERIRFPFCTAGPHLLER